MPDRSASVLWVLLVMLCGSLTYSPVMAQTGWELVRPVTTFDRYHLTEPDCLEKIRKAGNLACSANGDYGSTGATGWFEYDFDIPQTGWYELFSGYPSGDVEFIIDPASGTRTTTGLYIYGSNGTTSQGDKISNVWLTAGKHTLRIQRYVWTGFPPIPNFTIQQSTSTLTETIRASLISTGTIFRKNECPSLQITSGGRDRPGILTVRVIDATTGAYHSTTRVDIPASKNIEEQRIPVYCQQEGSYKIAFGDAVGHLFDKRDLREITYEVIDTTPHAVRTGALQKRLIQEIDCANTAPDYSDDSGTHVVRKNFGSYRESGDTGWMKYQLLKLGDPKKNSPEPSWFAYKLNVTAVDHPYLIEVDYPDDKIRTFAIALREKDPLSYPVSGGIDSGGEFSLSNKILTHSIIYWPRAVHTRLVFINARTGLRAAAAKIRVYQITGGFPALATVPSGGRSFVNWYEEGDNYLSLYGAPDASPAGFRIATERWASALRYMGGNVLSPAVVVYGSALYPSRYNRHFSISPENDVLRRMLLICEKYGIKLLPELHPRADELAWPFVRSPDPKPNLLVSKDGKTLKNLPPHYNPIYPANQDWYVNMIGELVDNYNNSPALLGVSLRLMQWQNPTLNNFHSLDWGYDDYTIERFQKETGLIVPGRRGDPTRFRKRYDWLMNNAKEKWISWRCEKIAELYTRIRNRVRQARPDLKVFSYIFDGYNDYPNTSAWLRGAGIDMKLLSHVDGVELVNALYAYGRGDINENDLMNQTARDNLLDPDVLHLMVTPGDAGHFLSYSRYFEALPSVVPPRELGFSDATRKTMMSAVINPAGLHFLERYAVELAETDASLLGDGGNGYTLGQPYLREFMEEYRSLPPVSFNSRHDARDPVAVWELSRPKDYLFYAVNRERFAVNVEIRLEGRGEVYKLPTHEPINPQQGVLHFDLQPYQLMTFGATAGIRILKVKQTAPIADVNYIKTQIRWLEKLVKNPQNKHVVDLLTKDQRSELHKTLLKSKNFMNRGWIWHARTLLENHEMLQIYQTIGKMPPGLRSPDDNK